MSYKVNKPTDKIKFHKKYYLQMLNGDKTQTMRLARKRLDVNENDIVTATFPGFNKTLKIKILKIGYKQAKSITDEDAKLEGYDDIMSLKNELTNIYPLINQFDRLYYYRFKVITDDNKL